MKPEKFDKSIRQRGACYTFKSPASDEIAEYLYNILNTMPEGKTVPEEFLTEGLFTIADGCEGSIRGAVQLFERCIYGELYTEKEIIEELNIVSNKFVEEVSDKLLIKKDPKGINMLGSIDFDQFYFMSRKAILNAYIYKATGETEAKYKWQIPMFKRMANIDHSAVLDVYIASLVGGFKANEDLFKMNILKYIEGKSSPKLLEEKVITKEEIIKKTGRKAVRIKL